MTILTPKSPKQDNEDDNTGFYVAIAALACLTVFGVASTAASYFYMKKKAAKVTLTDAAKVAEKVESTAA